MNEQWACLCRRLMACRGFIAYREPDGHRWVRIMGWIGELVEGKRERDADQAEKIEARLWLILARAAFMRNKWGFIEKLGDAGKGMQDILQTWDEIAQTAVLQLAERAAGKWKAKVHARIQGLGHAMGMITQAAQAAQAWEEGMEAKLKRQEAIYLIEQERERKTVQAQGWEWTVSEMRTKTTNGAKSGMENVTGWTGKGQQKLGLR